MFRQSAKGSVSLPVTGDWHCGPDAQSPKTFKYRVTALYNDSALDSHGFLLDNLAFGEYFAKLGESPVSDSCELLCKRICRDLTALASDRAYEVIARIWPLPDVYVEHVYRPGAPAT